MHESPRLQMAGGTVVISMEGPKSNGEPGAIIEIKGRGPNTRGGTRSDPKGNAKDTELYDAFVKKVRASRGSVKKCYETALKKRSDLQARPVTVVMTVDYRTSGKVSSSSFQTAADARVRFVHEDGRWPLAASRDAAGVAIHVPAKADATMTPQ